MQENRKQWSQTVGNNSSTEDADKFFTLEKQTGKRAIMLDIELKNGNHIALPYSYLTKIDFDLSIGITINWGATSIKIEGRNLNRLYDYLVNHRVKQLRAVIDDVEIVKEEDALFIEDIKEVLIF